MVRVEALARVRPGVAIRSSSPGVPTPSRTTTSGRPGSGSAGSGTSRNSSGVFPYVLLIGPNGVRSSPAMHVVHHSRWQPETDSNYGAVFSFWDRLFGTFRLRRDPTRIEFGIDGYDERDTRTFAGLLRTPFGPIKSTYGKTPEEFLDVPEPAEPEPGRPEVVVREGVGTPGEDERMATSVAPGEGLHADHAGAGRA